MWVTFGTSYTDIYRGLIKLLVSLLQSLYSASISLAFAPKKKYVRTGKIILVHSVWAKVAS